MALFGAIFNAVAIFVGGIIGILIKKGLPERVNDCVMKGLGLCVCYIGISGSLKGENVVVAILSMALGAIIGSAIDIDGNLNKAGKAIEKKFIKNSDGKFAEAFISFSLLVCVGAMAIVGSLESGLNLNHDTLIAKSIIDGLAAIVMASTMGIGVVFAGICVFIYEGLLTVFASLMTGVLNDVVVNEITCVGSLIILAIGLNMMKITNIKIGNYLPAIFLPLLFCLFI